MDIKRMLELSGQRDLHSKDILLENLHSGVKEIEAGAVQSFVKKGWTVYKTIVKLEEPEKHTETTYYAAKDIKAFKAWVKEEYSGMDTNWMKDGSLDVWDDTGREFAFTIVRK